MAENLENSPFADFIKNLDLSGIENGEDVEQPSKNSLDSGISMISSENDKVFTYDVSVGMASFRTTINTDFEKDHYEIQFPSRLRQFEADDMLRTITSIIDAAYPKEGYVPHAKVKIGEREEDFNLNRYLDGKMYEKALQDTPESLVYYIPGTSYRVPQNTEAPFRYGFHRSSGGDTLEFMRTSHLGGRTMNPELAQELLARHPGYTGRDITQDAATLKANFSNLGKLHPKQSIGWMIP